MVTTTVAGQDIVVFWSPGTASALDSGSIASGRDVGTAGIFSPRGPDGNMLTFAPDPNGRIVDAQTGSQWDIFGRAIARTAGGRTTNTSAGPHRPTLVLVGGVPPGYRRLSGDRLSCHYVPTQSNHRGVRHRGGALPGPGRLPTPA